MDYKIHYCEQGNFSAEQWGTKNVDNICNPLHPGMINSKKHSFIHTTQVTPQQGTEK